MTKVKKSKNDLSTLNAVLLIALCSLFTQILWISPTINKSESNDAEPSYYNSITQPLNTNAHRQSLTPTIKKDDDIPKKIDNLPSQNESTKETILGLANNNNRDFYDVLEIIDGDTIIISEIGTIRLIGIDTPETVDPRTSVQCYGEEATAYISSLLLNQKVYIEYDKSQGISDKYNRTLAYIYRADNLFINFDMIKNGFAFEYTYNIPYLYQSTFKEAQKNAKANGLGLWNPAGCKGSVLSRIPTPIVTSNTIITSSPTKLPENSNEAQNSCKYDCNGPDKDCSDFSTHAEAITFFECCNFSATNDPMGLDGLNKVDDGDPCESNK